MTKLFDAGGVWGLRAVCGVVILLGASLAVRADLTPREYRRMQREAPEELRIEVLGVHERPLREREREFEIVVDAKVRRINRTAARIHEGDVIKITYIHHRRDRPLPGPGEPSPEHPPESVDSAQANFAKLRDGHVEPLLAHQQRDRRNAEEVQSHDDDADAGEDG